MKLVWTIGIFSLFYSFSLFGFNTTNDFSLGFYWKDYPVKITILENDLKLKSTLEKLTIDAVEEWESRTGLSLWDLKSGTSNVLRWSRNFAEETKMDPSTVLAVAIRYATGPYFIKSEIVVNGNHPLNSDINNLLTTITHELGHTMGLDHSEEMQAVMAPTLQEPYLGLHEDDIAGMSFIYEETRKRQITGYISPLAYNEEKVTQPLGCGTVGLVGGANYISNFSSIVAGIILGFLKKVYKILFK